MTGTGRFSFACEPSSFAHGLQSARAELSRIKGDLTLDQGLNLRPALKDFYFFSLNLFIFVGIYLINHVVVISGEQ